MGSSKLREGGEGAGMLPQEHGPVLNDPELGMLLPRLLGWRVGHDDEGIRKQIFLSQASHLNKPGLGARIRVRGALR